MLTTAAFEFIRTDPDIRFFSNSLTHRTQLLLLDGTLISRFFSAVLKKLFKNKIMTQKSHQD